MLLDKSIDRAGDLKRFAWQFGKQFVTLPLENLKTINY
jgi:hypothetical protein